MPETPRSRWARLSEYGVDQIEDERTWTVVPARLIFPYSVRVPINSFADMLVETANWLIETKKITSRHCPVRLPRSRNNCLINKGPIHPDLTPMQSPRLLVNGWHMDTTYNAPTTVRHCRELLTMFDIDPSRVRAQRTVKLPERTTG